VKNLLYGTIFNPKFKVVVSAFKKIMEGKVGHDLKMEERRQ
jgi:hypothetical protein